MRYNIIILFLVTLSVSCSKVIDINYESIDDIYVVEASLSDAGGELLITKTIDMDKPMVSEPITSAEVSVSSSGGDVIDFEANDQGVYLPSGDFELNVGDDYTLLVELPQERFTSTSRLWPAPVVSDVSFSMQKFTEDMNLVFCILEIEDVVGQENYYRYRFRYIGNESEEDPSWSLAKEGRDGEPLSLMTHLYSKERPLEDGDVITIEVQAIDKGVYDYLYTLKLSGNSSTNPITNFSSGCLGYFSAYSLTVVDTAFYYADCQ